jgi:two-component system nitrogen regulation sensor histidine kinase GlnL
MLHNSNTNHCVFTVDRRLRINSWNKASEIIYGKSLSEVQGTPYYKVIPRLRMKEDRKDAVMQVLKNGKPITLASQSICFYGQANADIRITPSKNKTGKIVSANISIKAYPSCSIWKRLNQTQRFVDIGKIAATFAHGVRNPLNAIKGAVVYLREKYANEKKLIEFTKIIEEEISHLDNFIAKFLSTSVSDEGLSETDINSALKEIEVSTSLLSQSHKIDAVFEYGYVFPARINPFNLKQAILNIINNAIEAMPSGGRLTVKTRPEILSGTEFATIEISDTGSGIVKRKDDNTITSSKSKGRGLGLFITREILQSCKGHLEIKSYKGVGTTVKLYLPISK